mgnify:CR=1 FL=1|jgi:hypothetical protein
MYINGSAQAMMVLGVCATVAISVISIGRAYVRSIEASRKPPRPDLAPDVQDRMSRIEQAVDAIAIEVERMSEGQRFTTRLLAERFGDRARPDAGAAQSPARGLGPDGSNGTGGHYGR